MTNKSTFITLIALSLAVLLAGNHLLAQEAPAPEAPAKAAAESPAGEGGAPQNKTPEEFKAGQAAGGPDYQAYVFIAYGLTCFLLFLFFTWTIFQGGKLGKRIEYLEERFQQSESSSSGSSGQAG